MKTKEKDFARVERLPLVAYGDLPRPATSLPEGAFTTIVADPPWKYSAKVHAARVRKVTEIGYGAEKIRGRRGAEGYYPVMDLDAIAALPVESVAAENAHLYMWATNSFIEPAHAICRAWGFEPRTVLTWVKARVDGGRLVHQIGMGHYYRNNTEHVIFAVRGSLKVLRRNQATALLMSKDKTHSRKPDDFYALVESMSPGPYLEMFARRPWPGWTSWGNEMRDEAKALDAVDPTVRHTEERPTRA